MAVSHRAPKITPSPYIAGTTTPVAITATCSTVPPTNVQPCPGRPTRPAITSAARASTPPTTPACTGLACEIVTATGMASPITTTSKIRTVAHRRLTSWLPVQISPGRPVSARGAEQHPRLARRGRRPSDQYPGTAGSRGVGCLVGQRGGDVDGVVEPRRDEHPVRA